MLVHIIGPVVGLVALFGTEWILKPLRWPIAARVMTASIVGVSGFLLFVLILQEAGYYG